MKTTRVFVVLFSATLVAGGAFAQTVSEYGFAKFYQSTQTSSSAPTAGATPYGFAAWVDGSSLSAGLNAYTVTVPGGALAGSIGLPLDSSQTAEYGSPVSYADIAALNLAYGNGFYSMALANINGAAQSVTGLDLTGDIYPNPFQITGGLWSGGKLQVDPTALYTLNFTSFTLPSGSFGTADFLQFSFPGTSTTDQTSFTAVTSFDIPAFSLTPGQTYTAELVFINNVYWDMATIAGATGVAGYAAVLSFEIQAIPEPSTYAAILGAVALVGVLIYRRRRLA